jgi:hypothetical protein
MEVDRYICFTMEVRKGGVECGNVKWEGPMCLRRNGGKEVEQDFRQFIFVFTVEVVGMSGYIHSRPNEAWSVCVDSPASSWEWMKYSNILTTSTTKADTNWLKSGSTSFHPVLLLIHITPYHRAAVCSTSSTLLSLWDPYISLLYPPNLQSSWRWKLQCTLKHWNSFNTRNDWTPKAKVTHYVQNVINITVELLVHRLVHAGPE